ncbi:hypothetical protein ACHAWU_002350 [Discostella pseudostelligera]|uniref:SLC26A/SulP transporter domain-containing protein n=1 Tax=Discostella pseudostelligera TaxID=259834 RepID=A0ABD3NCU6_9STRA
MVSSPRLVAGAGGHSYLQHHRQHQHRGVNAARHGRGRNVVKSDDDTRVKDNDDGTTNAISTAMSPLLGEERGRSASKNNSRYLRGMTTSGLSLMEFDNASTTTATKTANGLRNGMEMTHDENSNNEDDRESYYGSITMIHENPSQSPDEDTERNRRVMNNTSSTTIPQCYQSTLNSDTHRPQYELDGVDKLKESKKQLQLRNRKPSLQSQHDNNPPYISILFGLVNSSIVLPIIMSFGSIIYQHEFFRPYLSTLIKLTVISGAVHQIVFSTISSLPFAVGQVQDAGLIFLSSMASDIVSKLLAQNASHESILATVTIGLSLYTSILGCALILVGKFQLASYCRLLPYSVVGGYLGYIGFFCGQAGLSLMAGVNVTNLSQWYKFVQIDALIHLIPGLIGGCFIYWAVRTYRHVAVLPACIVMLMGTFYAWLWLTGSSVYEATEYGWINKTANSSSSWQHTWNFLMFDKVEWTVLPSQTLTLLAMISVVSLSSSLDIAAIELELKRPLDYNHELTTVGISNILSGITGGYTGSYIFSQTIFSLRMGIRSRLMGYTLAFFCLVAVVIPINILAYVPNFFFGSLLIMICLDLMLEWLWDVREKVTSAEYGIVLTTFALLQVLGVEFGILVGCCLYATLQRMGFDLGNNDSSDDDIDDDDGVALDEK